MLKKKNKILNSIEDKKKHIFVINSFNYTHLVPLTTDDADELLLTSIYLMRIKHILSTKFPVDADIPPIWEKEFNKIINPVIIELKKINKINIIILQILGYRSFLPIELLHIIYSYNKNYLLFSLLMDKSNSFPLE